MTADLLAIQPAVLLGIDGWSEALAAADVAFADARRRRVDLVVLYHRVPPDGEPDAVTAQVEQLGQHYSDVKYRREVAEGSTSAAALIEAANKIGAGMIIVGSRGLGGFRSLATGSTSRALIEHADCPVTVVPPVAG